MCYVSKQHMSYITKLLVSLDNTKSTHLGRVDTDQPLWSPKSNRFLITKRTLEDTLVIEVVCDKAKTIITSMYFDINQQIGGNLNKIEAIIHHPKGASVVFAIDSNSRSTSWHNTQTNARGRIL